MNNDLISREALKNEIDTWGCNDYDKYDFIEAIDNAQTVPQQKVVTIPHELIEKLVLCVVDTVENIDWDKALEAYKERPQGKWILHKDYDESCKYGCNQCGNLNNIPSDVCPNCKAKMDEKVITNE